MPNSTFQLDVDASAIDSTLTNFALPVLSSGLPPSVVTGIFSSESSGSGTDVWFSSDGSGASPINAKLVYWDDGNSFRFDVKVASLSNLTGGTIYLHVGGKPGGYGTDPYTDLVAGLPLIDDFDDVSSNGNNGAEDGVVSAGAATGPDGVLAATSIDGTSLDARVDIALTSLAYPYSVEGWAKLNVDTSSVLASLADSSVHNQQARLQYASNNVRASSRSGSSTYTSTTALLNGDVGVWHHWAAVFESATSRTVYLDGVAGTTDTNNSTPTGIDQFTIGVAGDASPSEWFDGDVAGVMLHNRTVSDAEIKANYLLTGPNAATYLSAVEVPENTNTNLRDFLLGYDPLIYVRGYLGGNLGSAGTISTQGTPTEGGKLVRKDLQSSMSLTASEGYTVTDSGLASAMSGKVWMACVFDTTTTSQMTLIGGEESGDLRLTLDLNIGPGGASQGRARIVLWDNSGSVKQLIGGTNTDLGFTDGETHVLIATVEASTDTIEMWLDGSSVAVTYSAQQTPDTFDVANWTNGVGIGYYQDGATAKDGLTGELQEVAVGTGDAPDASALQDLVDGIQASYDQTLSDLTPTYAWALDEAFGTTAYNWIGAANNGTISGNVQLDQSPLIRSGRSMLFNSGGDSGNITTATGLDTTNAWSIGVWATTSASSGVDDLIVQQAGTGTAEALMRRTGDGFIQSVFGGSGATGSITVNDGSPHFIVQTFSGGAGGTLTQYVDGVLDFSTTRTSQAATGSLVFGSSEVSSRWFTGTIDEVAFWEGTALSAEDVLSLYEATAGGWNLQYDLECDLSSDLQRTLDVIPRPNYL